MQVMGREMLTKGAEAVNLLSAQLGYSPSPEQTFENVKAILNSKKHLLLWHCMKTKSLHGSALRRQLCQK